MNQQPPMHQLRMSPFNPFCGWTSSLPVEIFFSPPLCLEILYLPPPTYPLLPTTYQPHPPHSITRVLETSSGCGARAGAAGAGAGRAGVGAGPTCPRKGKMLTFFLFEEGLRSLLLFLQQKKKKAMATLLPSPSSSSSFFVALQFSCNATKKKAFFFFLFLCCTTAQLQHSKEGLFLLLFCNRRKKRRTLNPKSLNLLPHPQFFFAYGLVH